MVKRHHQIDFASGALVFPGGKTDPEDGNAGWQGQAIGWNRFDPVQRELRVAAIREVFEEAGILLANDSAGEPFSEVCDPAVRAAVDRKEMAVVDVVRDRKVMWRLDERTRFAGWITPAILQK